MQIQAVIGQLGQIRAQTGTAIPVEDRLIPRQRMVVVRLPHVDVRGERGEQIIVCAYVEIVAAEIVVAAYLADPLPPFRLARGLAHDDVRRQVDVLGELRRRDAAGVKPSQHGGQHPFVIRHPLQAGVGEDYIEIGVELVERPGVQHIEIAVGVELARRGDHVRRAVDAEDPRLRV